MSSPLKWKKVSNYCIQSGRYLIALVYSSGNALYVLHAGDECLGTWPDDAKAARRAAQKHSDQNAG